jgi:antitoxin component of MazEF toxin-antitoxin module
LEAERGQIKLVRSDRIPTLKELVAQITPENRYEEISTGPERGKEIVEW